MEINREANQISNVQLFALMRQQQKAQAKKTQERARKFAEELRSGVVPTPMHVQPLRPPVVAKDVRPTQNLDQKAQASESELENMKVQAIPFTGDEVEWLTEVVERNGLPSMSSAVNRLVGWANKEPPEAKKKLFLVIRCRRCSAGAKGGVKTDNEIELPQKQWLWLESVQGRCQHASVGKTIRIIIDFYMGLCKEDREFEQKILPAAAACKPARHQDAAGAVDRSRGLVISTDTPSSKSQMSSGELSPSRCSASKSIVEALMRTLDITQLVINGFFGWGCSFASQVKACGTPKSMVGVFMRTLDAFGEPVTQARA